MMESRTSSCYSAAMNSFRTFRSVLWVGSIIFLASALGSIADNWPEWRGPKGTGVCSEKNLPTNWSTNQNVRLKTALPEPGNSTPIVWGKRVFVTQAVDMKRTLMCFDRTNGKLLWQSGVTATEKEPTHETNP